MSEQTDQEFDRALEATIVKRLRRGESPATLASQLETRLDPGKAKALLASALARPEAKPQRLATALIAVTYIWTVLLALQNLGVLYATKEMAQASIAPPPLVSWLYALSTLKIVVLLTLLTVHLRWRNGYVAALYGAAILYAFPVGAFLERPLWPGQHGDPLVFLSLSAFVSYAAVTALFLHWRRNRVDKARAG